MIGDITVNHRASGSNTGSGVFGLLICFRDACQAGGTGPSCERCARRYRLANIRFVDRLPQFVEKLVVYDYSLGLEEIPYISLEQARNYPNRVCYRMTHTHWPTRRVAAARRSIAEGNLAADLCWRR